MSPRQASPLDAFLASAQTVLVVRGPGVVPDDITPLGRFVDRAVSVDLTHVPPSPVDKPDAVVVVLVDRVALRTVAGAVQHLPASPHVVCVLLELGGQPPTLVPSPAWPQLVSLQISTERGAVVMARFADRAPTGPVVAELARRTSPRHLMSAGWPVLGARSDQPHRWPAGDALAVVDHDDAIRDVSGDQPADLIVCDDLDGESVAADPVGPHPVTGRVQVRCRLDTPMTWAAYDALPIGAALARLRTAGPAALSPVDEQLVNPIGFVRVPLLPSGELRPLPGAPHLLTVEGGPATIIDTRRGPGDATINGLRPTTGISLTWEGGEGPHAYARTVAALAMAGVPLVASTVPPWARALLDPVLADLLETKPDLGDALEREVHSIRTRRAALTAHGARPRRSALATLAGERTRASRVSVLLATRRPELLEHALRQVDRQRGADIELVVAAHGFTPDADAVRRFCEVSAAPLLVVEAPSSYTFGQLLNAAAERATGDVLLKMDDDDWYGPDFVSDLLLARGYSGADLVGCPPEFIFVEPLWATVRRRDATEQYRPLVAGGTIMVSREAFGAVGGFRDTRKQVDANLFRALRAAGGSIYRSHGHNYVLRRSPGGHTWEPGLGYFVTRARSWQQWRGFRPSPLLDIDPIDRPARTTREESLR